jgi:hypothetical protein
MLRGLGWLAKLVAAGLIISFLSIWTTGYIVTSYIESVLKQYELPIDVPPMAMSGVWGKLWGSEPLLKEEQGAVADGETGGQDESNGDTAEAPDAEDAFGEIEGPPLTDVGVGKGSGAAGGAEAPETGTDGENVAGGDNGSEGTGSTEGTIEGTGGSDGTSGTPGTGGIDGTETALTPSELTETKDKMSDEDKDKLFELLMTKLPQESLQQISTYMEEGLTEQELINIEQIMAQYLDTQEYESMMDILKKY